MSRIILDTNDTISIGAGSSDTSIYGGSGSEKVIVAATAGSIYVSQSVERTELSGASTAYSYLISGNNLLVKSGATTVATIIGGNGTKTIAFSDGSAPFAVTGVGLATLGGQSISASTAGTLTIPAAQLNTSDKSASAPVVATPIPSAGQRFILSAGIDGDYGNTNFTGGAGDDKFVATDSNWGALDAIDGGAGNDSFTYIASTAIATVPAGAAVANIETVNLTSTADITANTTSFTGVNTLNIISGAESAITASATTDVNELLSSNTSGITGGKNVVVKHGTAGNVTVANASGTVNVTSTSGDVTVTQSATAAPSAITVAAKGNITAGGTSLDAFITGAVSAADRATHITAAVTAASAADTASTASTKAANVVTALTTMKTAVAAATTFAAAQAATATAYTSAGAITQAQKTAIDTAFVTALTATGGTAALAQAAALAVGTPILATATAAATAASTALTNANTASTAAAAVVAAEAGNYLVHVASSASALAASNTAAETRDTDIVAAGTALAASNAADDLVTAVTALQTEVAALSGAGAIDAIENLTALAELANTITADEKSTIDAAAVDVASAAIAVGILINEDTLAAGTALAASTAASNLVTADILAAATALEASTAASNLVTADLEAVPALTITDTANTALATASAKGNYTGTVTITDNSTASDKLTTVTLDNAGAATLTGKALTNVNVSNNATDVTITNSTVDHALNLILAGVSAGTYSDGVATSLAITSNGTANALTALTAGLVTTASLTGAGSFSANLTGLAAAAVITATTSTGANTVTVGAGQSYLGGAGVDTVTAAATLQTTTVSGGNGAADKLILTNATNFATTGAAKFTNFEVLQLNGVVADASLFTGSTITSVVLNGSSTLSGLTAAQAGAITSISSGTYNIGVTGATSVGQLDTVHITTSTATQTLTQPVLTGVETLWLTAGKDTTVTSLARAGSLTSIIVDGSAPVTFTSTGAIVLNVNTIVDAHASTGAFTFSAEASITPNGIKIIGSDTAANTLTGNAFAGYLKGGAGNDVLTGGAAADTIIAGEGNNTVDGNGGNDIITAGNGYNTITTTAGADTITVGTGANTITSGAGLDKITLGAHTLGTVNTIVYGATVVAATAANVDTITGFVSGADKIQLLQGVSGTGSLTGLTLATTSTAATMLEAITDTTSVATLADVYTALASATGLDNSANHAFAASTAAAGGIVAREVVYTTGAAAGTYLVINDSTAGFLAANDIVIKLVGNTTFAAGDIVVA